MGFFNGFLDDGLVILKDAERLYDQGSYEPALTQYNRFLDLFGYDESVLKSKAHILTLLERYDEAIECYDMILDEEFDFNVFNYKMDIYRKLNQKEKMLECYNNAIVESSNDSNLWAQKILLLIDLNNRQEAIKSYYAALEMADNFTLNQYHKEITEKLNINGGISYQKERFKSSNDENNLNNEEFIIESPNSDKHENTLPTSASMSGDALWLDMASTLENDFYESTESSYIPDNFILDSNVREEDLDNLHANFNSAHKNPENSISNENPDYSIKGELFLCPGCGTELNKKFKFCYKCGTKVDGPYFCTNCGKKSKIGDKFCRYCGNKID